MNLIERIEAQGEAFDYEQLDDATALEAKAVVERYRARTETYIFDTGKDLLAMKDRLDHGQFLDWTRAELNMPSRTAQQYMQAASKLGHKCATVAHLPATTIYRLTSASTPEHIRNDIVRRLEAKEALPPKAIDMLVDEAKDEARKRAADERETARRAALSPEVRKEEDALTARTATGRAARERRDQREREARAEEDRRLDAEAARGAAYLVDRMGPESMAAFFAQFDGPGVTWKIMDQARRTTAARLAQQVEPTTIRTAHVDRRGRASEYSLLLPGEREAIQAEAMRINEGGEVEPIAVQRQTGTRELYDLLDSHIQFRAMVDVLRSDTIPVRVAPAFEEIARAAPQ